MHVNFLGEAVNEDGSLSRIQPSEEHRRQAIEALGKILSSEHNLMSVKVSFVLPAHNRDHLDVVFDITYSGREGEEKEFRTNFSSGSGYLPCAEDMAYITLDHLQDQIEKAAK